MIAPGIRVYFNIFRVSLLLVAAACWYAIPSGPFIALASALIFALMAGASCLAVESEFRFRQFTDIMAAARRVQEIHADKAATRYLPADEVEYTDLSRFPHGPMRCQVLEATMLPLHKEEVVMLVLHKDVVVSPNLHLRPGQVFFAGREQLRLVARYPTS